LQKDSLMRWCEFRQRWHRFFWLAVVLGAAGLNAGCWQPLYGTPSTPNTEGVQDKFAAIDVPAIVAPKGTPTERVAIGLRNALQFDLHNGGNAFAPIYQLKVTVGSWQYTGYLDPTTGRPNTTINSVNASFQLIELATGKTVVSDSTFAHVDNDIPGSQQRFAGQRGQRDAVDHAVEVVAEAIRNRLASYFVAGT
jgi:LPS-assembly lipoprotein